MSDYIIGSDEVGYGAWAGPLYVCAVAVPKIWRGPLTLDDSKRLEPQERERLYVELVKLPLCIVSASAEAIDEYGVKTVLPEAHTEAIKELLQHFPGADVVVDGVLHLPRLPQARCVPHADALFPVVSAASVIAKVNRDRLMRQLHQQYPHYGWDTSMGYGVSAHRAALAKHGVCPLHRRSYAPIRKLLEKNK